jgi:hypothetical protein
MIQKEFTSSELFKLREIAEEEVEWMFSDAEEIGSSDMAICARQILETAKREGLEHVDSSFQLATIRGMISEVLCEMEGV